MMSTARAIFNDQMHFKSFERSFFMEEDYTDQVYKEWSVFRDNGITSRNSAFKWFGMDRIDLFGN